MKLSILDKDGNTIKTSRNLRGIRDYVAGSRFPIKVLAVDRIGDNGTEGKLMILFEDGVSFETNFASFHVLCNFVRRWRNVYGAPLVSNGESQGEIRYNNAFLRSY